MKSNWVVGGMVDGDSCTGVGLLDIMSSGGMVWSRTESWLVVEFLRWCTFGESRKF